MIIENYSDIAKSTKIKEGLDIISTGLEAANPEKFMPNFVKKDKIIIGKKSFKISDYSAIHTVAIGKAADSMTRALNEIISVKSSIIVIPKGSKSILKGKKFQIFNSGHPKPDQNSVKAAKTIIKFLEKRKSDELIIFLISGGGSALVALPNSITLSDKIHMTDLLLKSGATIQEFNCVRKHLSKIKGGKLLDYLRCQSVSFVMSDVEGDDLSAIASGITYMDNTTFLDAENIIKKYKLEKKVSPEIIELIEKGVTNQIPETPKKITIPNQVVATNKDCLNAMSTKAKKLGYNVNTIQIFGNIKGVVSSIVKEISKKEKTCLIFGGEPTVEVIGKGSGGRNQELVLRIIKNTQKFPNIVIASVGTDGIDGNTVFAGAISENLKIESTKLKDYLKNSNSNSFFQKYGGLIKTGHTHTNLMDIGLVLQ